MEALKNFSIPFERSHKPAPDRTEGVRKFLGRDGKPGGNRFGGRPGGFKKRFDNAEPTPKVENAIDKISL